MAEPGLRLARLYYLDWLRVIAMFSIFLFHSNRLFDDYGWHVKDAEISLGSTIFVEIFNLWMIPLFFVLSGAAVYYSLQSRTAGGFLKERTVRILLPLAGVGWFAVAPPEVYLERLTHGQFSGSFFEFYPHYFEGLYGFGGNFAFMGVHLWYLTLLFLFSLFLLPVFMARGRSCESIISGLARRLETPWALFFLFFPLAAAGLLADAAGLGSTREMGSWDILTYYLLFIYGYLLFSSQRLRDMISRYGPPLFILGLVLAAAHVMLRFAVNPPSGAIPGIGLDVRGPAAWALVLGLLGVGSRRLNFNNKFLGYANEAVLPFYILHQTVILIVGFFIVQSSAGVFPKYLAVVTTSFIAIMAIYELAVRRLNLLRFLFGMRVKKTASTTTFRH